VLKRTYFTTVIDDCILRETCVW